MASKTEECYPGRPLPPVQKVQEAKPAKGIVKEAIRKQNGRNGMAAN